MRRLYGCLALAVVGSFVAPGLAQAAGSSAAAVAKAKPLLINGRWVNSRSKIKLAVKNPFNDKTIGHIAEANQVDVDRAVDAANSAFAGWSAKLPAERADLLLAVEKNINDNRIEIAKMVSSETGKPYVEAYDEVGGAAASFGYYANLVKSQGGRVAPPASGDNLNYVVRAPLGVVAAIVPFNFPLLLSAWKVAPALAAGNTVVIKPPHQNPLSNLLMAKLFSGLPKGVVNVVTGAGSTGALLAQHPDVNLVAFTGSSKVGAMIAAEAGKDLKIANLELGGIDGSVVFADADIDHAAKELAWARGTNAGQVCTSPKRIIVDAKVADAFTAKLIEHVKAIRLGDPMDPNTDMGPLVSQQAREGVEKQLAQTLAEGGKLLYQAKLPEGLKGQFFPPAVVQVKEGMTAARDEVFGPVYTIIVANGEDDAIRIANSATRDTGRRSGTNDHYGLGASAFTTSQRLVQRASNELKAGNVWVNQVHNNNMALPFGGWYQSGKGAELGIEGLDAFTVAKNVNAVTVQNQRGDGFPYSARKVPGQRRRAKLVTTAEASQ